MLDFIGKISSKTVVSEIGRNLNSSISKLSTGKKDLVKESTADYHVAKSLEQRVRTSEVAMRNINTASNMLSIAEGALENSIDKLISLKKVATLYNDGATNAEQKEAILNRMNAIGEEISDILNSTNYNGFEIFNTNTFEFQVGSDSNEKLSINFDISNLNLTFSEDPLVDLAILMDNSGSLGEEQEGVANNLSTLVEDLESENVNLALSLTRFGAAENNGNPIVGDLTTDTDNFIKNIWNENTLDGYIEPTFNAIAETAENMDFRTGSNRFFMVIGDENPNQGTSSESDALNAISSVNGNIITVTDPYYFNEFNLLTNNANGLEIDINSNFSDVISQVNSQILDNIQPDFLAQIEDNLNELLGIAQNIGNTKIRLNQKESNLSNHILNTENSRSRIEDVDIAREMMKKMKAELLLRSSIVTMKNEMNSMPFILQLFS